MKRTVGCTDIITAPLLWGLYSHVCAFLFLCQDVNREIGFYSGTDSPPPW